MHSPENFRSQGRKPFFVLFFIAAAFAISYLVMWLWNAILPELIHVNPIGYWQAMGLLALCRILFGGFHFRKPYNKNHRFANQPFQNRWMNLSDEEKVKMKNMWKDRCAKREGQ